MDREGSFFVSVLNTKDLKSFGSVSRSSLSSPYQPIYDYVLAFLQDNQDLPNLLTVRSQYPFIPESAPEDASFYASEIKDNAIRVAVEEGLREKVVPSLRDEFKRDRGREAFEGAKAVVAEVSRQFQNEDTGLVLPDVKHDVNTRWKAYEIRKEARGITGIPTPWPTITGAMGGIQAGEIISLLARPSIGKSWMALLWAVYLWQIGFKVLFISMETPPQAGKPVSVEHRIIGANCFYCGASKDQAETDNNTQVVCRSRDIPRQMLNVRIDALGARVSAWRLLKGNLTPGEEGRLKRFYELAARGVWGNLRVVANPHVNNIISLEMELLQYHPDVVFWDSAYLGAERWKFGNANPYGQLLIDFKMLCRRLHIPGVLTWHFNREVDEKSTYASTNCAALTDDMARVCDVILGLFRPPEILKAREAVIRCLKIRDGLSVPALRVNFKMKDTIDFSEIPGAMDDD